MMIRKLELVFTIEEITNFLIDAAADVIYDEVVNGYKRDKLREMLKSGSIMDHFLTQKGFDSLSPVEIVELFTVWGYSFVEDAVKKIDASYSYTTIFVYVLSPTSGEHLHIKEFDNYPDKI